MTKPVSMMLTAAMLFAAAPAHAQSGDVVVTNARLSPEEARKRAFDYVRRAGVAVGERPAARWIDKVCPRVTGLAGDAGPRIEARIREVAKAAGAPLAGEPCTPNATIRFVADARETTREIARRGDQMRELPVPVRRAVVEGDAPVRWWYKTGMRSRDGERMLNTIPAFVGSENGQAGQALPVASDSGIMSTYGSSLVSTQVARGIEGATLIVDADRVATQRLDALADYIALVTLAEVDPLVDPAPDSVLGLFAERSQATALSAWDERFLRALYSLTLDRRGRQHRGALAAALLKP